MNRYKRMILQAKSMSQLIKDIQYAFEKGKGGVEIDGEIKKRLMHDPNTADMYITGYYVVLRKRLSFWQWLKFVFWK